MEQGLNIVFRRRRCEEKALFTALQRPAAHSMSTRLVGIEWVYGERKSGGCSESVGESAGVG